MDITTLRMAAVRLGPEYLRRLRHDPSFQSPTRMHEIQKSFGIPDLCSCLLPLQQWRSSFNIDETRRAQAAAWVRQRCDEGDAMVHAGDLKKAQACYDQALEMEPNDVSALTSRAELGVLRAQYGRAIDDLFCARKSLRLQELTDDSLEKRLGLIVSKIEAGTGVPVDIKSESSTDNVRMPTPVGSRMPGSPSEAQQPPPPGHVLIEEGAPPATAQVSGSRRGRDGTAKIESGQNLAVAAPATGGPMPQVSPPTSAQPSKRSRWDD